MVRDSCEGCKHYLGGGCCRVNLETECAAGGYEAYEHIRHGSDKQSGTAGGVEAGTSV